MADSAKVAGTAAGGLKVTTDGLAKDLGALKAQVDGLGKGGGKAPTFTVVAVPNGPLTPLTVTGAGGTWQVYVQGHYYGGDSWGAVAIKLDGNWVAAIPLAGLGGGLHASGISRLSGREARRASTDVQAGWL